MLKPETKYAKSGDVYIAYQVCGEGPFDMVMAPGTVSHLDLDWATPRRAEFLEEIAGACRLIRFDKRGTGLSDRPTEMATLEQRTDDIRAVMDEVGLERAVIFGGSEGASMACMFAATYPQRVQALVLWGGMAKWVKSPDHPWGLDPDLEAEMVRDVQENWPSEWYIRGPGAGYGPDAPAERVQSIREYMRAAASPSAAAAYERMNAEIDTRPILGAIQAPTLVLNREGDPVAHVEGARDMARRIRGAKFKSYPGRTHAFADIVEELLADISEFVTGVRPVKVDDRVLSTVLFVDIAGSTEELSRTGDGAWKIKLDQYYKAVRGNLDRFRGVERNVAGDGIMATFDGPARAVKCALAISAEVRTLDLHVRAGVHTGEIELMGDNIGGIAVHIASRIQGEAKPGQVAVSNTTKDLVAGSGITFADIGARRLRGVDEPWNLFAAG